MTVLAGRGAGHHVVVAGLAAGFGAILVVGRPLAALVAPALVGTLALMALVRWLAPGGEGDGDGVQRRILRWTLAAFAVHLLIGLVVTNVGGLRQYLGPDSFRYHQSATELVGYWTSGSPAPVLPEGKEAFYYALAGLYWVFGPHTSAGLVLNAALGAALVPILYDATQRLFGRSAAHAVPLLVVLVPGFLVWPSQLLKEAAVLFLIAVAASCAIRTTDRVTPGRLATLTFSLALLFAFRSHVGLVVAAGIVLGIMFGRRELLFGVSSGLSALSLTGVVVVAMGLGYSGYQAAVSSDLREANNVRRALSTASEASSGFAAEVDISTSGGALLHLPAGVVSLALGPFPWQIQGFRRRDKPAWRRR